MSRKQKIHPVTLWMFAFVIIGLWAAYGQLSGAVFSDSSWFEPGLVTIMLVFIAGVSLWTLPVFFNGIEPSPNDKGRDTLGKVAGFYIEAWNQLRGEKWLLWLFGSVATFKFVGLIIDSLFSHFMLSDYAKQLQDPNGLLKYSDSGNVQGFLLRIPAVFISAVTNSIAQFDTMLNISSSITIYPLFIGLLSLVIYLHIRKISEIPKDDRSLIFIRRFLPPFIIISILSGLGIAYLRYVTFSLIGSTRGSGINQDAVAHVIYLQFYSDSLGALLFIITLIFSLLFFAGFAGSLLQSRDEKPVDMPIFISNIARYSSYMLRFGILLLITHSLAAVLTLVLNHQSIGLSTRLVNNALFLFRSASILLILFVPYDIVTNKRKIIRSIYRSLVLLKKNMKTIAVFISLGITIIVPLHLSTSFITQIVPGRLYQEPGYDVITSLWYVLISMTLYGIMSLSIFNLYNYLTKDDVDEVTDTEPILEEPDPQQWSMREV